MQKVANVFGFILNFDWVIITLIGVLMLVSLTSVGNAILSGLVLTVTGITLIGLAGMKFFIKFIKQPE